MFELTEEEKEHFKKLDEEHDKYMRKKYGDRFVDEILPQFEKRLTENILASFDNFAEVSAIKE